MFWEISPNLPYLFFQFFLPQLIARSFAECPNSFFLWYQSIIIRLLNYWHEKLRYRHRQRNNVPQLAEQQMVRDKNRGRYIILILISIQFFSDLGHSLSVGVQTIHHPLVYAEIQCGSNNCWALSGWKLPESEHQGCQLDFQHYFPVTGKRGEYTPSSGLVMVRIHLIGCCEHVPYSNYVFCYWYCCFCVVNISIHFRDQECTKTS